MSGQGPIAPVVPVVAGGATVAALPTTGADTTISIAAAIAVALVAWGVVYYFRVIRKQAK